VDLDRLITANFCSQQLTAVFKGYNVMSTKIIRDENTGISKGVGFARLVCPLKTHIQC
jgi:hypothetical protein